MSSTARDRGIADHRDQKAIRRVDGDPYVIGGMDDQVVAVEGGIELGKCLEGGHHRLDHQRLHGEFHIVTCARERT